jgi:endonuclease YncB( thermonuclease family)
MRRAVGAVLLGLVLGACAVSTSSTSEDRAVVERWADGDSLTTSRGEVRLIGIDTPERGACGSDRAKAIAERLAPPGAGIRLVNPSSVVDQDRFGRLLRYVEVDGVDIGLRQIRAGAVARYDGLDGYDEHPRQAAYRREDAARPDHCE